MRVLLLGLLLMADFGQFEATRQNSQPLEGYQFFRGNASTTGSSASPSGETLLDACPDMSGVWSRDRWTGGPDTDITGRVPDGGGNSILRTGVWTDEYNPDVFGFPANEERTQLNIVGGVVKQVGPGGTVVRPFRSSFLSGTGVGQNQAPQIKAIWHSYDQANDDASGVELYARWNTTTGEGYNFYFQNYNPTNVPPNNFGYAEVFRISSFGALGLSLDINNAIPPLNLETEHTFRLCVSGAFGAVVVQVYLDNELILSATDTLVDGTEPVGDPGWGELDYHTSPEDWPFHGYSFPPYDSQGVEVTEFTLGGPLVGAPGNTATTTPLLELNYTTADVEWTYEGDLYTKMIGHRTEILSGSSERTAAEFDLSVPFDHPVATLAQSMGLGPIGCRVIRLDRQDLSDGAAAIIAQTQITRVRMEGRWCVITLGNLATLLSRTLPQLMVSKHCVHIYGGPRCQMDLSTVTHSGLSVTSVAGRLVVVAGASALSPIATYFQEGVLVTADGLRVSIESQDGDTLTLKQIIPALEIGAIVTLQRGCLHIATDCDAQGNIGNFGGKIGIPNQNPWYGAGLVGPTQTDESP